MDINIDSNLKRALEIATGNINLDKEYISKLDGYLDLSYENTGVKISNLKGIEYAINIGSLDLNNNDIEDVSILVNLKKIEWLNLSNNKLTSIESLSDIEDGLINLNGLDISNNNINIEPYFSQFIGVNILELNNISEELKIQELNTLYKLKNLIRLSLKDNGIVEIFNEDNVSLLDNLKNLEVLDISNNKINNIKGIEKLVYLNELSISNNKVKDIGPIEELKYLEYLDISNNEVEDISALKNIEKIEKLYLENNYIKLIEPIKNYENIKLLSISKNKIEDLDNIPILNHGGTLLINSMEIESIDFIGKNVGLYKIEANNNNIKNIDIFKDLKGLGVVLLERNNIKDLSILQELKKLSYINLNNNNISNIVDISCIGNLRPYKTSIEVKNQNITLNIKGVDNKFILDLKEVIIDVDESVPNKINNILPYKLGKYKDETIIWEGIEEYSELEFDFSNYNEGEYGDKVIFSGNIKILRE